MDRLLQVALSTLVRRGTLQVATAHGRSFSVGDGTGDTVAVRFKTPAAQRALLLNPELVLGESYMDRTLVMEQGSIADLLALVGRNANKLPAWMKPQHRLRYAARRLKQHNARVSARRNVAHHYDLDSKLYSFFLDDDRQYSCAYFEHPGQTLDDAQLAKKRHLAAKLVLKPGLRVLDIGCGWGGLGLYLAEQT